MKIRALHLAVIVLLACLSVRSSGQILSRQPHLTAPPPVSPTATLPSSIKQPPPPPPEKKKQPPSPADKLDYFAGVWQETGEWKASALGPAGWFDTMDYNQRGKGRLSQRWVSESGGGAGVMTYRYDSKERVYTCHESDTQKSAEWEGTLKGDTWTWTGEAGRLADGRMVKGRLIEKEISPVSYSIVYEISIKGGKWTKVMEGSGSRKEKY